MSSTGNEILTAEIAYADPDITAHPGFRDERVPISRRAATINARTQGILLRAKPGVATDLTITARVDHSRAQFASTTDPYFLCADCFNRPVGGKLIAVVVPAS